ncbi:TRAP transporter small permease [Paenibacillus sp. GCM10023248]|uniref:TRAP transporter small permease n=1 Tax=Bacillales TaxID=1385 RepID=UPI0023794B9B|nr:MULTISPECIES: TRAP transporter small permease [Bacillales]MDD9268768.1 TRAP transporter small permease [Paenibacillus sp. MAHUQ-63]MDR6882153.1 TRAP-type C4-dicarboxylate transport system permease small subunit [Bacillus sp. 3255]
MHYIRKIALWIDTCIESAALIGLLTMIIIVTLQVMTRKLFDFVFFWSEEVTMLLLVWFSFMGIAIGFREKLHLGIDSFTHKLPPAINKALDKIIQLVILAFGIYLVSYGWDFTVMMHESELPATGLPNSTLYAIMPITGIMTCAYALLQLCGIETKRHAHLQEGDGH